jgi:hypothetical protein
VKKLAIVVLLVVSACRREVVVPPTTAGTAGAATPREAVNRFMAAAKVQDLQAMSNIWGTPAGPASSTMGKEELEMRELIMMRCLKHDSYAILSEAPAADAERVFSVELRLRNFAARSPFTTTRGPQNRWYVKTFEIEPLRDICTTK